MKQVTLRETLVNQVDENVTQPNEVIKVTHLNTEGCLMKTPNRLLKDELDFVLNDLVISSTIIDGMMVIVTEGLL